MNLVTIATRSIARNRFRTGLTVAGVAVAVLAFVLLRTVIWSWTAAMEDGATDRLGIRHKITFFMLLPRKYVNELREIPGVTAAAYANWFGARYPKHENEFFATIAVEPREILALYPEVKVPAEQVDAWAQNRRGALVGDALAKKFGWKLGQKVTLSGTLYPGDWDFEISGIYTATRASIDRSTFYFHWQYMNESLDPLRKDEIGWMMARITDPRRSAEVCRAVDAHFATRDVQTLCMSERAMQASILGMMSAVLRAINIVSFVILAIMALVIGNTIAMGVRERTTEYGTLRALGFSNVQIGLFIVAEAIVIGTIGAGLGLVLSYPLVEMGLGRFIEENLGQFFPFFRIQPVTVGTAIAAALVLSGLAALAPAYATSRLKTVEALRRA